MTNRSDNRVTFFARTNFRNEMRLFGIRRSDRLAHTYLIGKTGTGKSTLLETMIRQDVTNGEGFVLLDPHGDLIERVLPLIANLRAASLVYFNVPETADPLGFNPLEQVAQEKRGRAASGLLEAFKKIWADSWGPRMEHILRNALLALLDRPESTLADVLRLLEEKTFRRSAMVYVTNSQVRNFWLGEFERYPARLRQEAISPIQNKVGAFLANPVLNKIMTKPRSDFDLKEIMDEGKILLVNLAKGKIGEDTTQLLGSLLVSSIGLASLHRADMAESRRRPFFVYLDEFQSFTTLALANMLSEIRKYKVGMVLAHQYLSQMDLRLRDAILGNAGTVIAFRVGLVDAQLLAGEFHPHFSATDLTNLPNYNIYLKQMIDGKVSKPFSAVTVKTPAA